MALMKIKKAQKLKKMKIKWFASGVLLLAATVTIASNQYSIAESNTGKWDSLLRGILNEALQGQQPPAATTEKEAKDASTVEAEAAKTETKEADTTAEQAKEETGATVVTQKKPEPYDALKAENEQLQRQITVLRDMKFQETMRRIEGFNLRKAEVERKITFLESEKTELANHINYLEKQLEAYQGKSKVSKAQAKETTEPKDETPAQN